ncbi:unnamed protein product [Brugia pahangi]|uniref:Cse1 domain-containing protein n=1 Tax=Brugia pahangi TaxID=6280 RepID=A0A0N4TKE9_BRUPA|nr:unnamed protein product [Brugia pahangi]
MAYTMDVSDVRHFIECILEHYPAEKHAPKTRACTLTEAIKMHLKSTQHAVRLRAVKCVQNFCGDIFPDPVMHTSVRHSG